MRDEMLNLHLSDINQSYSLSCCESEIKRIASDVTGQDFNGLLEVLSQTSPDAKETERQNVLYQYLKIYSQRMNGSCCDSGMSLNRFDRLLREWQELIDHESEVEDCGASISLILTPMEYETRKSEMIQSSRTLFEAFRLLY
jgi:hypothetical protein